MKVASSAQTRRVRRQLILPDTLGLASATEAQERA